MRTLYGPCCATSVDDATTAASREEASAKRMGPRHGRVPPSGTMTLYVEGDSLSQRREPVTQLSFRTRADDTSPADLRNGRSHGTHRIERSLTIALSQPSSKSPRVKKRFAFSVRFRAVARCVPWPWQF